MLIIKRIINTLLISSFLNIYIICLFLGNHIITYLLGIFLVIYFIKFNIKSRSESQIPKKLLIMINGFEITLITLITLLIGIILNIILIKMDYKSLDIIINLIISLLLTLNLFINGLARIFFSSNQVGIYNRAKLLLLSLIPIINIFVIIKCLIIVHDEFIYELTKITRNETRKNEQICNTKYPILLVHGVFFRDSKYINYWGRIPKELTQNGATIYYGNQESSASVAISAEQIKETILEILKKEKTDKVNIIAHSKGGLDSRYMISLLNMEKHVASLTTINTCHQGTCLPENLIDIFGQKSLSLVAKGYNSIYHKLGDTKPDFYSGVISLTKTELDTLNQKMLDKEGVLYQSVGSIMNNKKSSFFPLSFSYGMIKKQGFDNDGLVPEKSMEWGNYLGTLTTKEKKGISHGDMIDLTRKNIKDFDVCEYYVQLVASLKEKGL